jgi:hypothetical protein
VPRLSLPDFITRTIFADEYRSLSSSLCSFFHVLITSSLLGSNILPAPYFQTPSAYVPPSMWATKFHTHKTTGKIIVLCILIFKFLDSTLYNTDFKK